MKKSVATTTGRSKPTREEFLSRVRELAAANLAERQEAHGGTFPAEGFAEVFRASLRPYRLAVDPWLLHRDAATANGLYRRRLEAVEKRTKDEDLRRRLQRAIARLEKDELVLHAAHAHEAAKPGAVAAEAFEPLPSSDLLALIVADACDEASAFARVLGQLVGPEVKDADLACAFALLGEYDAWTPRSEPKAAIDVVRRAIAESRRRFAAKRDKLEAEEKARTARNLRLLALTKP